jgi:hypothetical protein
MVLTVGKLLGSNEGSSSASSIVVMLRSRLHRSFRLISSTRFFRRRRRSFQSPLVYQTEIGDRLRLILGHCLSSNMQAKP